MGPKNEPIIEPIIYSEDSRDFFLKHLITLVSECLDFKEAPPVKLNEEGKFRVDADAIIKVSQIASKGDVLSKVISDFTSNILQQSLNFGSPAFLAHPDNGSAISAMIGDVARGLMQQNLVSYEYSPAATYVEYTLLKQIRELIGYRIRSVDTFSESQKESGFFDNYIFGQSSEKKSNSNEDFSVGLTGGAFVFGGTNANFTGLLAAREKLKKKMLANNNIYDPRRVKILTKIPFAHYSLRRSASLLGLGNEDLTMQQLQDLNLKRDMRVNVESKNYKMDVYDLEVKINQTLENGDEILSVFAIAGDSRMVSFDNLKEITKVADKYSIWVHADGCEGGQCLFSPNRRHLWNGVEMVNSISLDPHKVLMIPYNLSVFMLRDIEDMELIDIGTSLVRLGSLSYGTFTPGIGSKDFGSLRLWFLLKHLGWDRLASEIDKRHELAKESAEYIKKMTNILLINKDIAHNAVAFVFCPKEYLNSADFNLDYINQLNKKIHHQINCGSGYHIHMMQSKDDDAVLSNEKKDITILRMMFGNPNTTISIVKQCLDLASEIGQVLFRD